MLFFGGILWHIVYKPFFFADSAHDRQLLSFDDGLRPEWDTMQEYVEAGDLPYEGKAADKKG